MRRLLLVLGLAGLLLGGVTASGQEEVVTLTFDELSPQPANGVSIQGVTFGFEIAGTPSTDATYGGNGPGDTTFVQDPSLEGNSNGVLTVTFDTPTTLVQFGLARSTFDTLSPGLTVELFDEASASIGTFAVDTTPMGSFSEAQFTHDGAAVKSAVITFPSPQLAARFAFDNLTYFVPAPASAGDRTRTTVGAGTSSGWAR